MIQLINLQRSHWSSVVYVNIGLYIRSIGDIIDPKEYDCHIRYRLSSISDRWLAMRVELTSHVDLFPPGHKLKASEIDVVMPYVSFVAEEVRSAALAYFDFADGYGGFERLSEQIHGKYEDHLICQASELQEIATKIFQSFKRRQEV